MENNQNTQQQSAELSDSQVIQSRQHIVQRYGLNLAELIKRRPWIVWIGVLVFLYTITAISISSLLQTQTNNVAQQEPESTSVTAETPTETSPIPSPRSLLHLWLMGAVALSFVAGSLFIAQRLKVKYPIARSRVSRQLRRRQLKRQRSPVFTNLESPPLVPMVAETEAPVTTPPLSVESPAEVKLPRLENSHAHASGEVSLAEMMDIRKHLPLSVILGDCDRFRHHIDGLTDKPVET